MLVEHRAAFTALLWGGLSLLVFMAPLFIYAGEYSEASRKQGGADGGDYFSMIGQGVGLHIAITFLFLVAFEVINLVFTAVPDMQPKVGLENFYSTAAGGGELNEFILKWMTNHTTLATSAAPVSEIAKTSFIAARLFIGIAMTFIFLAIPAIILVLSLKAALQKPTDETGDPLVKSVTNGVMFFIGATLLVYIHSLISSTLVKVGLGNVDFSFFEAMQKIWRYVLFGI